VETTRGAAARLTDFFFIKKESANTSQICRGDHGNLKNGQKEMTLDCGS